MNSEKMLPNGDTFQKLCVCVCLSVCVCACAMPLILFLEIGFRKIHESNKLKLCAKYFILMNIIGIFSYDFGWILCLGVWANTNTNHHQIPFLANEMTTRVHIYTHTHNYGSNGNFSKTPNRREKS